MLLAVLLGQTQQYVSPTQPGISLMVLYWLPALIGLAFYVLLAFCIYRAAKYFGSAAKEQKLLRIEMGKLAEEVHLLRQKMNGDKKQAPSTESA